ncbi:hypothetical protein LguiA_003340 [Lonicera macranthoides]
MGTKLIQPPIPSPHVAPSIPGRKIMKTHTPISATHHSINKKTTGFSSQHPVWIRPIFSSTIRVAEQSSGNLIGDHEETRRIEEQDPTTVYKSVAQIKSNLYEALQGINRGIFGVTTSKKTEIEELVKLLEAQNPTSDPTLHLDKVSGWWKLVYSTIRILGSKRTKLGLRDFITLGDFLQNIDVAQGKAFNVIKFNARGLNLLNGKLTIEASFKIASESRVNISYNNSTLTPEQLMSMFRKNYDLLLEIFNPEGWLEITYVDDMIRIGRDDKGNIFILERSEEF